MKTRKGKWIILLMIGMIPFLIAFGFCFFSSMTAHDMPFWDYIFLYSFLYWPTYVIGIILIVLSLVKIKSKP